MKTETLTKVLLDRKKIDVSKIKLRSKGKNVQWREWNDPLRPAVEEYHEKVEDGTIDDDEEGDAWKTKNKIYKGPVLVGQFGYIPIREESLPSKNWNFYVGDLNFPINDDVYKAMRDTPGVDIFKQWTRYRIWLGVGTNFDSADVKKAVEENAIKATNLKRRV